MDNNDGNNFKQLIIMVGENYNKPVSDNKLRLWWELLKEFNFKDIERAAYKHMKTSPYMVTPDQLIKHMQPDFDEIFDRLINKGGYHSEIEKLAWSSVGYACRTQLKEDVARSRFKNEYLRQLENSKLPRQPQTHRIDLKPVQKETDKMVDDGIDNYKGKSPAEMKELLAKLKYSTSFNKALNKE